MGAGGDAGVPPRAEPLLPHSERANAVASNRPPYLPDGVELAPHCEYDYGGGENGNGDGEGRGRGCAPLGPARPCGRLLLLLVALAVIVGVPAGLLGRPPAAAAGPPPPPQSLSVSPSVPASPSPSVSASPSPSVSASPSPSSPPNAFVMHVAGPTCPPGWLAHVASQGRIVLPVSSGAGISVDHALADGADALHTHTTTLSANSGNCRMSCLQTGGSDVFTRAQDFTSPAVESDPAGSGFPLLQLQTCMLDVSKARAFSLPAGMFAFFDSATTISCPSGFSPLPDGYDGRVFVPYSGGDPALFPTFSSQEPVGYAGAPLVSSHAHDASGYLSSAQTGANCGTDGLNDAVAALGSWEAHGSTSSSDANLPYISLLSCVGLTDAPSVAPEGMLAFTTQTTCPQGWAPAPLSSEQQGSFIVGTPAGGRSGAMIGTAMKLGNTYFAARHTHTSAAPADWPVPSTVTVQEFVYSHADYACCTLRSSAPALDPAVLAAPYVQLLFCVALVPTPSATATASASATATASASATKSATATASASATASGTSSGTASAVSTLSSTASASAMTTTSSTSTASYSATPTPTTTPSNGTSGAPAAVASAENSALAVDAVFGAFGAVVVALSLYTVVRWMRRAKPDSGDAYMRSEEEYLSREAREDPVADVLRRVRAFMRATGTGAGARSNSASTTPLIGGYAPPAAAPRSSTWEIASAWGWGAPAWGAPAAGLAPYSAEPQSSVNADPKTPDPTAGMDDRAASLSADAAYY